MSDVTIGILHDWDGAKWQVIFGCDGEDFCRESQPADMPQEDVVRWAQTVIDNHPVITHATVERW